MKLRPSSLHELAASQAAAGSIKAGLADEIIAASAYKKAA
jgi:hypothetical protein